jgi:hypothetical protein
MVATNLNSQSRSSHKRTDDYYLTSVNLITSQQLLDTTTAAEVMVNHLTLRRKPR